MLKKIVYNSKLPDQSWGETWNLCMVKYEWVLTYVGRDEKWIALSTLSKGLQS